MSSCKELPKLAAEKNYAQNNIVCEGTDKKVEINCPEVLIKFGEVEITQEIELGYDIMSDKFKLRATSKKKPSFKFKYDDPKYLAGSLVQLHDYYALAEDRIVNDQGPEVVTRKASISSGGELTDVKLFKIPPWEYFGAPVKNAKEGWDFGNPDYNDVDWIAPPISDFEYNPDDPYADNKGLRQAYLKEAYELVGDGGFLRERGRELDFEQYFTSKAIRCVDYTNEMRVLYALAATGQLPYDVYTKKYRIGNDATNPGYTRNIKIVLNLYFKAVRGEFSSTCGTFLDDMTLEGKPASQSLVGHRDRSCLKVVVVLNKRDGSDNRKGVYYFGIVWGKANPAKSFLPTVNKGEPAHGIGTKKAPGKSTIVSYSDSVILKNRVNYIDGEDLFDRKKTSEIITFENNLNPWGKTAITRTEYLRFIRKERQGAYTWSLAEATNGSVKNPNQWRTIDQEFWTSNGDYKQVRIARPTQKQKNSGGWEITPGMVVYFTAGQNITSGDIAGSSMQFHFILPMEAFAVLLDEEANGPTNLVTLPGKFWNMFSMGVFVVKFDAVQVTKDSIKIVNMYLKMEAAKEAARKMKEYLEGVRARFVNYTQELGKAFEARNLAKYNEILNAMKELAADFQKKTGQEISLKEAIEVRDNLKIFIDAQNQVLNPPNPEVPDKSIPPEAPDPPPGDPQPDGPSLVSNNEVIDSGGDSLLVIPVDPPGVNPKSETTNLVIDPVILNPGIDTPNLGSTHNLGNIGSAAGTGFDQVGDAFQNIPGVDLGITHDTNAPSWYDSDNY